MALEQRRHDPLEQRVVLEQQARDLWTQAAPDALPAQAAEPWVARLCGLDEVLAFEFPPCSVDTEPPERALRTLATPGRPELLEKPAERLSDLLERHQPIAVSLQPTQGEQQQRLVRGSLAS